ncbi:MAG: glycosyltransferase, partial [Bryobacteraceae bacterium]|nr:glycosyltransferase [Bryobacteraceae bacterium]
GAAAARNRGAATAQAPLVMFLDDDMLAGATLIEAHLAAHNEQPGGVVLGYFPLPELNDRSSVFAVAIKIWWDERFAAQARPEHRYTFQDLCTGNVSMPKELFTGVGGFDEALPGASGEDYELGARLLKRGVRFRFVREAASVHCDRPTARRCLARARADGFSQVILAQRHPELFSQLKLGLLRRFESSPIRRAFCRLAWRVPGIAQLLSAPLRVVHWVTRVCGVYGLMWRAHALLDGYHFWCGVRRATGSYGAWRQLCAQASVEPPGAREIELDVADDLPRLATILEETPADAVRLRLHQWSLGRIPAIAGAERLRAVHVRHALVTQYADALLALPILAGLESGRLPHEMKCSPRDCWRGALEPLIGAASEPEE